MKKVIGFTFILAGAVIGPIVGFYVLFIGGIIEIIDGAKANPTDSEMIAWGIARVVLASPVGYGIFWVCLLIGSALLDDSNQRKKYRSKSSGNRRVELEWERRMRDMGS